MTCHYARAAGDGQSRGRSRRGTRGDHAKRGITEEEVAHRARRRGRRERHGIRRRIDGGNGRTIGHAWTRNGLANEHVRRVLQRDGRAGRRNPQLRLQGRSGERQGDARARSGGGTGQADHPRGGVVRRHKRARGNTRTGHPLTHADTRGVRRDGDGVAILNRGRGRRRIRRDGSKDERLRTRRGGGRGQDVNRLTRNRNHRTREGGRASRSGHRHARINHRALRHRDGGNDTRSDGRNRDAVDDLLIRRQERDLGIRRRTRRTNRRIQLQRRTTQNRGDDLTVRRVFNAPVKGHAYSHIRRAIESHDARRRRRLRGEDRRHAQDRRTRTGLHEVHATAGVVDNIKLHIIRTSHDVEVQRRSRRGTRRETTTAATTRSTRRIQ